MLKTWLQVSAGALAGSLLGAVFGLLAGWLAPGLFVLAGQGARAALWNGAVLGAIGGVLCGGALSVFALWLEAWRGGRPRA